MYQNFNDHFYGFLSLFQVTFWGWTDILAINTVDQAESDIFSKSFFIIFYFIVSIIGFNIILGILINDFSDALKDEQIAAMAIDQIGRASCRERVFLTV